MSGQPMSETKNQQSLMEPYHAFTALLKELVIILEDMECRLNDIDLDFPIENKELVHDIKTTQEDINNMPLVKKWQKLYHGYSFYRDRLQHARERMNKMI